MHFLCLTLVELDSDLDPRTSAQIALDKYGPGPEGNYILYDWYQFGGRWTGVLTAYDPTTDPDNFETCPICKGTGFRNDDIGKAARKEDSEYKCNGCKGERISLKWPTEWIEYAGDVKPTSLVIEQDVVPYAIVTPTGALYIQQQYGLPLVARLWRYKIYSRVSAYIANLLWKLKARSLLGKYKNTLAVVVDCHS